MIAVIRTVEEISHFVSGFLKDVTFSDPMLRSVEQFDRNVAAAVSDPERYCVIGVYSGGMLTGVFSFLISAAETYLEMLAGLSREGKAYEEMLDYLKQRFPFYEGDFVYNPRNYLIQRALEARGAAFDPEQLRLLWKEGSTPAPDDGCTVVPYEDKYRADYFALHQDEGRYWTAEKVAAAADRFHIFLALRRGRVVGYIDVTYSYAENEPYDLFVCKEERQKGYGKALLEKALAANGSRGMAALVERDNIPAVRLFQSMGFVIDQSGGSVLARLTL